jgi:uncharacterized protein YbjT (DUF2867 family)
MRVLVTGGTGVVGRATITELLRRGHQVRLLSRGAEENASAWHGVEPFAGDVTDAASIAGAADGCGVVIHAVGIVAETPPGVTFAAVNVNGTANMLAEAARARIRRFVFISSLGCDRGASAYHRSKCEGEELVKGFTGDWSIVRTGAVMGPGDETVSILLRMMRTLPVVPILDNGGQPFQPVWHEDVAWALAEILARADVTGRVLRVTGEDVITVNEVLDILGRVTDRHPLRLPLPGFLARVGTSLAAAMGVDTPVAAATVEMLLEGNFLRDGEENDLTGLLGYQPLPTRNRLIQLADEMPEQTPEQGVGKLQRRRFRIDIHGGMSARDLGARFRERFGDIVPFEAEAEPGSPSRIRDDATLTLELPARGHVQVRVAQLTDHTITLATIEGHPLAGIVRFHFAQIAPDTVRFTIDVAERAASRVDQLSMAVVGSAAQKRTWKQTAERVAADAGGSAPEGVVEESWSLDDDEAAPVEAWVRDIVQHRQRRSENRV